MSQRTARKWVGRYRDQGEAGLADRSSAPESQPGATPEDRIEAIAALRRVRLTGAEIAEALSMALDRAGNPDPDRAGQALAPGAA